MDAETLVGGARGLAFYELLRQRLTKAVPIANPAAGADWTQAVPAGVAWEVLSIEAQLLTSAVVANRNALLRVRDPDGREAVRIAPAVVQAASLPVVYTYLPGFGAIASEAGQQLPLPSPLLYLPSGWQVGSLTTLLDVGDQWSAIVLTVREWSGHAVLAALDWLAAHTR